MVARRRRAGAGRVEDLASGEYVCRGFSHTLLEGWLNFGRDYYRQAMPHMTGL